VKLLPDDASGPVTLQTEDDTQGKCLAKTYQSTLLKSAFPADDFMSADGKDGKPGSVTVNFFPNLRRTLEKTVDGGATFPAGDVLIDSNTVSSVLVNLGTRPSC